jgi:hypothetical protein
VARIARQALGQNTARRSGADYDVVPLSHQLSIS